MKTWREIDEGTVSKVESAIQVIGADELLRQYREVSCYHTSPEGQQMYHQFLAEIGGRILCLVCVDERLQFSEILMLPPATVFSLATPGAGLNLENPEVKKEIEEWVEYTTKKEKRIAFCFPTYHFSQSPDLTLGCKAHNFDTQAAEKSCLEICAALRVHFKHNPFVVPIPLGIETDTGRVILRGPCGELYDTTKWGSPREEILRKIRQFYPQEEFPYFERAAEKLSNLVFRNTEYVRDKLVAYPVYPSPTLDHDGHVIYVGPGRENLSHSQAFGHTPHCKNFEKGIAIAGSLIEGNIAAGRVVMAKDLENMSPTDSKPKPKGKKVVIVGAAATHKRIGSPSWEEATRQAVDNYDLALRIIKEHTPGLIQYLDRPLRMVIDLNTLWPHEVS